MGNLKGYRGKPLLMQAQELGIEVPPGVSRQRIFQLIQEKKQGKPLRPASDPGWSGKRRRKGTTRSIAQTFW